MTEDEIPVEFRCELDSAIDSYYYDRCKRGEDFLKGILTDGGWWWDYIKTNEDIWKFALAAGYDWEGNILAQKDESFKINLASAFYNKFWHMDHGVLWSEDKPLQHNGRLAFLGTLQVVSCRALNMQGVVGRCEGNTPGIKSASEVLLPPPVGTYNFDSSYKIMLDEIWPEPSWTCPDPNEPYDWANPMPSTPQSLLDASVGPKPNQVKYKNTVEKDLERWTYVITLAQKEFHYGITICQR
jgi:hypothetical protein